MGIFDDIFDGFTKDEVEYKLNQWFITNMKEVEKIKTSHQWYKDISQVTLLGQYKILMNLFDIKLPERPKNDK